MKETAFFMKSNFLNNFRLAGFPLGLGLTSVLVSGTLNRVMIVELDIPAFFVGLFFAIPLLISPLRIWLGYRSDAYPLWGLRREPFIILGAFVASLGVVGATLSILNIQTMNLLLIAAVIAAFSAYGVGRNLSSNTFEALLADKFTGDQRPRAVTFFKVAMFGGIIIGAVLLGRFLDPFSTQRLLMVVIGASLLFFVFTVMGILQQEPRKESTLTESEEARGTTFFKTFKTMIWADPQVRRFFFFVMLTVIGTLAQDILLEPYAALVLGMSVGETASLEAIWGAGTLLSMAAAGAWLIKRFGYQKIVHVGLILGVLIFTGLILSGVFETTGLFLVLVFFLGVSTGLSASGMLTTVIEFTTPTRAGLLMGVWGVAHNLGQALGGLISGGVVDIVRALQGDILTAYGAVFALEALLLLSALWLMSRIQIQQARILTKSAAG
jgi:MFS transporter, BCD family, chlorophyll transporter